VKTILVVDDDFPNLQVLNMALTDAGYRVFTTWNGRDGLQLAEQHRPDLILSDWMMPIMDGEAICRALQAGLHFQSIPIVIMSGLGTTIIGDGCKYVALIDKPFRLAALLETITDLIGSTDSPQGERIGSTAGSQCASRYNWYRCSVSLWFIL
jgi:CheY-like chemotaxis protein